MIKNAATPGEATAPTVSSAVQLDDHVLIKMADNVDDLETVTRDAAAAAAYERKMTLLQAIRMYPKPVFSPC